MLALVIKGISFHGHRLNTDTHDKRTPSYLALNPKGQVPTLVSGDENANPQAPTALHRFFPSRPQMSAWTTRMEVLSRVSNIYRPHWRTK